jgi:phospholipase C
MSETDKTINRRTFLQLTGATTALAALQSNINKALAIPAHNQKGTIEDVEHIVILMQENRPFDHHFGTIAGVRGYADPRAIKINLPLNGGGTAPASVFLQPAGSANKLAGFSVPSGAVGGPPNGVDVLPPFRVDPSKDNSPLDNLGGTYMPGTDHSWGAIHDAWNHGKYDNWANRLGPIAMNYMTRADVPYHCALADAFTVGDAYFCSVMGPTNPNRDYLWTGCIGNLSNLGPGGTDGAGAGPVTANGLSSNGNYYIWKTYPERLIEAGITWKIYQDLAGATFFPDFGWSANNRFAGNYGDTTVLYFNQYATSSPTSTLFKSACTGTRILDIIPPTSAPDSAWEAWADHLFDNFRNDVKNGTLPQVSWISAPEGYTEHSDSPMNYGAWYISKIFDILVSNPDVFSKTVFIVNYDEADGSFDHLVPPVPPQSPAQGASTVSIENEIVTTSQPNGPIGLAQRVPFLVISPWTKGGYVNSQVFDHSSVIQFIEKRFGVHEPNISPWRRSVTGDLTSIFNFSDPNSAQVHLPSTDAFLPSVPELKGGSVSTFIPNKDGVIVGIPAQEKGVKPARALPYEMDVQAEVNESLHHIVLTFINSGDATVVFHVRNTDTSDPVRDYTVEPGKQLQGTWNILSSYNLSVHGPNGFIRFFKGSIGSQNANLDVECNYHTDNRGSILLKIKNSGGSDAEVNVLDAYTGDVDRRSLHGHASFNINQSLERFYGWYDLIITVTQDASFNYRLAGHVETKDDSISDPALGGLVHLKG